MSEASILERVLASAVQLRFATPGRFLERFGLESLKQLMTIN
jgi:chromosome segregation and condensation protein ScpB